MPSTFCDLPPEIHHEIISYLNGLDSKNVSETCNSVRPIYQNAFWKTCMVNGNSGTSKNRAYGYCRLVSFKIFQNPKNYKSWFRTEFIEVLLLDFPSERYSSYHTTIPLKMTLTKTTINLFPSLKKIDAMNGHLNEIKKNNAK